MPRTPGSISKKASKKLAKSPAAAAAAPSPVPSTGKTPSKARLVPLPSSPPEVAEAAEDEGSEESDEEDDDGVDEEGLKRIMELLDEDDIDEPTAELLQRMREEMGEEDDEDEEDEESSGEEDEEEADGAAALSDESESDEDEDEEMDEAEAAAIRAIDEAEADGDDDEEEAVELDEASDIDVDEDAVRKTKVTVNNKTAISRILKSFALVPHLPFIEHLSVSHPQPLSELGVTDPEDDLTRELGFYKQALHAVEAAKPQIIASGVPFSRPADYFAEMVKSDEHMERIRQRLLDERAGIQASENARKQRELKKFGKKVQTEKLQERERNKKEMVERVKGLKRKRKDALETDGGGDDDFDVQLESALDGGESDRPSKRGRGGVRGARGGLSRNKRDQKFGFGGKKRNSKANTRESTHEFGGGGERGRGGGRGGRGGKRGGGAQRPGKSKRMAARGRA